MNGYLAINSLPRSHCHIQPVSHNPAGQAPTPLRLRHLHPRATGTRETGTLAPSCPRTSFRGSGTPSMQMGQLKGAPLGEHLLYQVSSCWPWTSACFIPFGSEILPIASSRRLLSVTGMDIVELY